MKKTKNVQKKIKQTEEHRTKVKRSGLIASSAFAWRLHATVNLSPPDSAHC